MTATATKTVPGKPVALGRYETDAGTRLLVGRRIEGSIHVYDGPAPGSSGRTYFVDAGFESKAELAAFVVEYRRHGADIGCSPMSGEALDQMLGAAMDALA